MLNEERRLLRGVFRVQIAVSLATSTQCTKKTTLRFQEAKSLCSEWGRCLCVRRRGGVVALVASRAFVVVLFLPKKPAIFGAQVLKVNTCYFEVISSLF